MNIASSHGEQENPGRQPEANGWSPPNGSWASSPGNRKSMLGNRSRDTGPELAVRKIIHGNGLRYRVHFPPLKTLRRRADLVFGPARVAVFIDGCYWHGCPTHYVPPKTNSEYWSPKIGGNIERDRDTDTVLAAAGWLVLRFWEHEDPARCADQIIEAVTARRGRPSPSAPPTAG